MSRLTRSAAVAFFLATAGCGSGGGGGQASADAVAITTAIDDVEGFRNAKAVAKAFSAGAAPPADKLKAYGRYSLGLVGPPTVQGDTATAKVRFTENSTGKEAGTAEWALIKEGGQWKIKSAPLP